MPRGVAFLTDLLWPTHFLRCCQSVMIEPWEQRRHPLQVLARIA